MRDDFIVKNVKRVYFSKTRVQHFTTKELILFKILQIILTKSFYFVHSNIKRQLFIDLNVNKMFDFDVILYYVKKVFFDQIEFDKYFFRHVIELIFFFNRFVIDVKTKYWFTKFEIIDIVWIFKKIKHIVEISSNKIIMYIDHELILNIIIQITIKTISINKFNLRFVRVSNYIQRFNFDIRHKFNKQHIIFDVLSRLINDNVNASIVKNVDENEFDVLFIISFVEMNENFRNQIIENYKSNLNWQKINDILNVDDENVFKFSFCKRKNDFIFRFDDFFTNDHVYEFRRFCIFHSIVQDILNLIHDDEHVDYVKCLK